VPAGCSASLQPRHAPGTYRGVVTAADRPLLFLDVDGVLLPFGAGPDDLPGGYRDHAGSADVPHPLLGRLDPGLGPRLVALGCELVWASTWGADANDVLAPWLGLPALRCVALDDDAPVVGGLHWKTATLLSFAGTQPFAWLDDEVTALDAEHVRLGHGAPALVRRVDHRFGVTDADLDAVAAWRVALPGAA
jgi:hypothetical protein